MIVAAEKTMITAEGPMIVAEKRGIATGVTTVAALQGHQAVSLASRQITVLILLVVMVGLSLWLASLRRQTSSSQNLACPLE